MARFGGLAWYHWTIIVLYTIGTVFSGRFETLGEIIGGAITSMLFTYLLIRGLSWVWGAIKSDPYEDEAAAAE